jgi:hypothetical protein
MPLGHPIKPQNGYANMRKKYGSSDAWRNFARRITRNLFAKAHLFNREGGQCALCSRPLGEVFVIHHIDYDHTCSFNKTLRIDASTPKRPGKLRTVPDCEACKVECEARFRSCLSRVTVVHKGCNARLSLPEGYRRVARTMDDENCG